MLNKNNYDSFFRTKTSRKQNIETKTTLDTLHKNQLQRMNENEDELSMFNEEKKNLEEKLKECADSSQADQIENRLKEINNNIKFRKNKNEFLDYYLDTGEILYNYYDIQEKIQDGVVMSNKRKQGTIYDILEKASKEDLSNNIIISEDKSYVSREKLLEDYLGKIHPECLKMIQNDEKYGECPDCEIEMVFSQNEAMFTCAQCGHQEFILMDSDKPSYKDPPREVSYYAYKRINHFNEWLAQFQAKESTDIPQEVFDSILVELKKERILDTNNIKASKIREILKKLKMNKYYEHVPHIINRLNGQNAPIMNREVEERLRYMFKEIQPSFQKYCPPDRNNFLSYSYVLYKFCELLELDEYLKCFPLLKNRDKLFNQDKIWQQICSDMRWEFIRSI